MACTAIVTDSASDLAPEVAGEAGITVVPLMVSFGDEEFRTGVDLSMADFYTRLTAPGAPFPKTAACSPGAFGQAFQEALDGGHDGIVCVTVGARLSATHRSAEIAREALPDARIHVIDSATASMGLGLLALLAAELARRGDDADTIAETVRRRVPDSRLYVALDTLEYLKRGGRISGAQAAIGSILSVKPIITISDGVVETVDRPRTRGRARARVLELLGERRAERGWILHTETPDVDTFADEVAQAVRLPRAALPIGLIGPSVAPHVGPGAYGAAVLRGTT